MQCSWVVAYVVGVRKGSLSSIGILSLGFVCLAFVLSACYLVPPGLVLDEVSLVVDPFDSLHF